MAYFSTVGMQVQWSYNFFHISIFLVNFIHLWQNGETVHFQRSSSCLIWLYIFYIYMAVYFFHLLFSHTCSYILWSNAANVFSNCTFSNIAFFQVVLLLLCWSWNSFIKCEALRKWTEKSSVMAIQPLAVVYYFS